MKAGWKAQADKVVRAAWDERQASIANGTPLKYNESNLLARAATYRKHADDAGALARDVRDTLAIRNPGMGEEHIPSARELADKYYEKAIGGPGIDYQNCLVGNLQAREAWALSMEDMHKRSLAAYQGQEEALYGSISAIGEDL